LSLKNAGKLAKIRAANDMSSVSSNPAAVNA
jgi:hypothetical protein